MSVVMSVVVDLALMVAIVLVLPLDAILSPHPVSSMADITVALPPMTTLR
jgi:hypothetical protein